jgi:hypothetical protein
MRSRRQRARTGLKWSATGIFVGLALLLPANLLWRFRVNFTPTLSLRVYDGLLALGADDGSRPLPAGVYWQPEGRPHLKLEFKHFGVGGGGRVATVPIVLPLVFSAAPAALLWWRERVERRRLLEGHCRKCGYDLSGLGAPTCPECGAPAPTAMARPGVA